MFDDGNLGFKVSDSVGTVEATVQAPSSKPGTHVIKVTDGNVWVEGSFILIDATPIAIDVEGGSNLLRGETARFYALTTLNGQPVDVTSINANLYLPNGAISALTVQHIGTGLYVASYTIPINAPFGAYLIAFNAQITDSTVQTTGSSASSFAISDSMNALRLLVIFQYVVIVVAVIVSLFILYVALKRTITRVVSEKPETPIFP
jgi:hypothetical protein